MESLQSLWKGTNACDEYRTKTTTVSAIGLATENVKWSAAFSKTAYVLNSSSLHALSATCLLCTKICSCLSDKTLDTSYFVCTFYHSHKPAANTTTAIKEQLAVAMGLHAVLKVRV